MEPVLDVEDLTLRIGQGSPPILDSLSLTIHQGEVLALVGESGSGKSMTALSVVDFLPPEAERTATRLTVAGVDTLTATKKQLSSMRGGKVGMLFQQPKRLLDPTCTVGRQIAEPLRLHRGMSRSQAKAATLELLCSVGVNDPVRRAGSYPHQLSGGLAQRMMIAIALAGQPQLLIADEPTTALDNTVEAQILELIAAKQRELGMAVLFISHDLRVVSSIADRIAVMYAGRIVEVGPAEQIVRRPRHPYTQALVECSLLVPDEQGELFSIPGTLASARTIETGCRFAPRCHAKDEDEGVRSLSATQEPELAPAPGAGPEHLVRCWAVNPKGVPS